MIILFSGSHGTGKSTLLELLSRKLPHLKVADSVSEKFFKREDFADLDLMVSKQAAFTDYQLEVFKTNDTLSSRSYADIWAYTKHLWVKSGNPDYLTQMTKIERAMDENISDPDLHIIHFPIHFEISGKDLRSTNKDFQREIDHNINTFWKAFSPQNYHEVIDGSPEERLDHLLDFLDFL